MRISIAASVVLALALASCESSKPQQTAERKPTAALTDLTTASSLAPVRAAFNAHKGEARFLTLLSPT